MPDATITSTASTFGTISGVFSADQSTISGTISGIVPGTLTGSVGVPGPAGPGVPAGGTSGQFLQKTSGVDYATDWVTVNLTGLATESWVTAGFYPLTGNPSSFLTASALTPYLTSATASTTYQTLSGMSDYLSKAGNLSGLASTSTARTNLGLGSLAVVNDAPSDGSQYARKNGAWDVVTTTPDYITSVSSPLSVTSGNLTIDLSAYAPLASPAFTGNPTAPTATFGDNDTSLATTAFVQSALAGGTAVARDLEVEVRNQSGSTIAAGSIVYISGATGNKPLITLAQANNDANSAQTIGFVKTAIANNGTGYVIVRGELENIDTSALTEGVQLYLSPTTAGTWTTTKPSAPQHLVYVGIVIRSHPTLGTILVAVQNGYELDELHDVAIASKANNNLLAYESSTDLWKNKTYSALGLLTSADAASTYLSKSGGTLNNNASILFPVGGSFTVSNSLSNQGILIRDASNVPIARFYDTEVLIPSVGITFSDATNQTTAGLSPATAASTYYLQTNPAGYITSAALSGLAPLASPALTGNVTITSNSTGAALFIEQAGTGNILTLHDQAADTTFVAIDQNGKINTIPSVAASAGFNVPHGAAPTTPVNGDIWTTTTGLFMRQNGFTKTYANYNDASAFSNPNQTLGNSTAAGTINIGTGATISGATKAVNIGTAGVAGSTTNITVGPVLGASTTSIGGTTAASTLNLATGATLTATTKAVNIGTAGVAGSTTNIAIGSTTGTSTTTLQGTTNGVTAAVDTNSVALATTAYVVGQAGSATPLVNGTAAVGTSLRFARQDHVHPTDTTRLATANNLSELTATASTARTNLGLGTVATVNDAPSDGSTYGRNNGAWVVAGGGGGGGTDYQAYTTAGTFTWTKPAGAKWVEVIMFGAGGGGGAGGRYATSSGRAGGGGGGAGGFLRTTVPASTLNATESVTVAAGGLGGASVTTDTTAGNGAPLGSSSTFSIYVAAGGSGGGGGTNISSTQGSGRAGWFNGVSASTGSNGSSGTTSAGNVASNTTTATSYMATGGAGGAGAGASSTVSAAGASGGNKLNTPGSSCGILNTIAGGAAGTTAGVSPTAGVSNTLLLGGGTGGGSGAYRTAVAGMAGALGGSPGGGGGGGSASDNGFASGAGGAGGSGAVYIITYC